MMAMRCPRCTRKLSGSEQPDDPPPAFCMYCGFQLRTDVQPLPPVMPDDDADSPSLHAETMAFVPQPRNTSNDVTSDSASVPLQGSAEFSLTTLSGYQFMKFLGAGGMGTVYEAQSTVSGKKVAVKLLSPKLAANPSSVERFRQEGRVASQITHPRCVFVLRADTEQGRPFIIMELMPGRTLKDLVDLRGPLKAAEAIDRIIDVIDGLSEAHRLGVIHRDVKPSNCFLTDDDRIKVGDFGLSKSLLPTLEESNEPNNGAGQLTQSGAFLGTVMYASPEQIRGEQVSYDSDIYSVCATLYYLLTGKAPFQHESLTASLAKAVSEAAPPIRDRFPDVPRELEKVVLRGLDRDRSRRYQTLEELRDALLELRAERQQPATPRSIVLSYILDSVLLQFLTIPAEVLRQYLRGKSGEFDLDILAMSWPGLVISLVYFTLFEGLIGATPGKRLLRLMVVRLGAVGPPGVLTAGIRAFVFITIWTLVYLAPEYTVAWFDNAIGLPLGFAISAVLLVLICSQFRRTLYGRRGVHDFAAGTRVIQRPRLPHRPRLFSHSPNPLERLIPRITPLPAMLGSYSVTGKLCDLPDSGEVWLGEDRVLGRRVLIRLLPSGEDEPCEINADSGRPTRLRVLSTGAFGETENGNLARRAWIAYVAPAGAPLIDVVGPEQTVGWIDARPILEQLADELLGMEQAQEAFTPTAVEQLWVEPNGRIQRLEFPLPTGRNGNDFPKVYAETPMDLIRVAATVMLEGKPRTNLKTIQAPVPSHARQLLRRLTQHDRAFADLKELKQCLVENQHLAPELNGATRAGHIGVLAMMLAVPMIVMFTNAALICLVTALGALGATKNYADYYEAVKDPARRQKIMKAAKQLQPNNMPFQLDIEARYSEPQLARTLDKLEEVNKNYTATRERAELTLSRPERWLLWQFLNNERDQELTPEQAEYKYARNMSTSLLFMKNESLLFDERLEMLRRSVAIFVGLMTFGNIFMLSLFALVFRGGLSNRIAGVTIINRNGQPAGRLICFVREWFVWLPMASLLLLCIGVQMLRPEWVAVRIFILILALLCLPLYIVIALRRPSRPPHDRILGMYLMPE